jgi:hypothetical protein
MGRSGQEQPVEDAFRTNGWMDGDVHRTGR